VNKVTRILLAIGMILAVATPALAEFKFNGFYRLLGYVEEKKSTGVDEEGDSQQFIDQRFRAKLTYTLNDNVSVVYFAEIDTPWGETGKAAANSGGVSSSFAGGADGVNVETKNVYLDLKSGDTAAQLGIIGVADNVQSIVANDDMAGLQVTHKIGGTSLKFAYSKWDEDGGSSTQRSDWDDFDFYLGEVSQKFSDSFTAGANVYYMDDNTDDLDGTELFFYGLNADAKFGDFGINGFAVMQDGEDKTADVDVNGWAASVKGTMKISNGDVGLRLIYFTDADENDEEGAWQGFKGQYEFVAENQMQFLCDPYVMNDGKERYAINDAAGAGYGLMAAVLSGNHTLPSDMYLKWGLGYYRAAEDEAYDSGVQRDGKTLGYEVAARVGKKYFEKVDVSLNASYADYGNFYNDTIGGTDDPDATYKTYLMVNVPF